MHYIHLKTYVHRSIAFMTFTLLLGAFSCVGIYRTPVKEEPVVTLQEPELAVVEPDTTISEPASPEEDVKISREMYTNFILASLNIIRRNYKEAKDYLSAVIENDPNSLYLNKKMAVLLTCSSQSYTSFPGTRNQSRESMKQLLSLIQDSKG